ncbi:MAG: hypothetical protein ACRD5W_00410 [Candidatus Acidiferrales bacterium]
MNTEKGEARGSGEVLQFPSRGNDAEAAQAAWENAVLEAMVEDLRGSPTRKKLMAASHADHARVEALLRSPRFRGRLAECAEAYLTEQLPEAMKLFSDALRGGQSWAFKVLFDAIGLPRIAESILRGEPDKRDVIISDGFERELDENILDIFRGCDTSDAPGDSGGNG